MIEIDKGCSFGHPLLFVIYPKKLVRGFPTAHYSGSICYNIRVIDSM